MFSIVTGLKILLKSCAFWVSSALSSSYGGKKFGSLIICVELTFLPHLDWLNYSKKYTQRNPKIFSEISALS